MGRTLFYIRYALRNIQRGGRWTTLAILCIAAGVATIVALRGLGLAIGDVLVENVRTELKGDILLYRGDPRNNTFGNDFTQTLLFQPDEIQRAQDWATDRDAKLSAFAVVGALSIAPYDAMTVGRPQFIGTYLIDPETYPPSHDITALEPEGVPLAELFTDAAANEVVISANMAQQQALALGDQVRIAGTAAPFTVRGIVDTTNESGLRNILNAFFGFVYIDIAAAQRAIDADYGPNALAIQFSRPPSQLDVDAALWQLRRLMAYPTADDTALSLLARNQAITQVLGDFIVVLGLGALLIGGVGIMNTMLVMVRRRTLEIAALKTLGLKSGQVSALFLTEALLLGLMGSVSGSVAGVLLGGVVNQYGAAFLQQPLPWRIYPEALLYGFVLGMVITAIFGVAPILTALQVRPAVILRPNETPLPRLGIFQALLLLLLVVVSVGIIAGQIVRPSFDLVNINPITPYIVGIIGVGLTLLLLTGVTGVLWLIVWLVGKLPSFGQVEIRLALRNLSAQRLRTATTLLALCAGTFALSSIAFMGQGAREALNQQLTQQLGGNVLVFPASPGAIGARFADTVIGATVANLEGVNHRTEISTYRIDLVAIDGRDPPTNEFGQIISWENVQVWHTDNPALYENERMAAGRNLTLADAGQPVIVGGVEAADALGIQVGSVLTYRVGGQHINLTVVGLKTDITAGGFLTGSLVTLPSDVLNNIGPLLRFYTFDVQPEHVNEALLALAGIRIPPTFALDVTFIDSLLGRLIDQFAAIPTVVGLLSLLAAAIIMANTVALGALERRKQIGILKALGLQSRRVLLVMLLESSLVGLLSAVIGIGLSSLFVALFTSITGTPIPLPRDARLTALLLLVASVLIGWLATFLSANIAVREHVMSALRQD